MKTILITPATFAPMEVDYIMARPEIRGLIGGTNNDRLLIADFLASAINAYEEYRNGPLCSSIWDMYLDSIPDEIELPVPLADSVVITYLDSAGASTILAAATYKTDIADPVVGRVTLAYGQSWPTTYDQANSVVVRFTAGYASVAAIPARIKDGLVAYIQGMLSGVDMSAVAYERWSDRRKVPV
jgi:hypothetical protein